MTINQSLFMSTASNRLAIVADVAAAIQQDATDCMEAQKALHVAAETAAIRVNTDANSVKLALTVAKFKPELLATLGKNAKDSEAVAKKLLDTANKVIALQLLGCRIDMVRSNEEQEGYLA